MNSVWGRRESKGWPSRTPNYTITALMIALASAILTGCCRYYFIWTPLERHYLREYFLTGLMARLGAKTDRYDVLTVITRKNYRLAVDEDVAPFKTPFGATTFTLSEDAGKRSGLRLTWLRKPYNNVQLHALLASWIYHGQTLADLAARPLWVGLAVFLAGLPFAAPRDAARLRELRYGRRLKGPELVTGGTFNSRNRSRGIGFSNYERTPTEKIFGWNRRVRVPQARESSHFLIIGDTGAGKSTLIRQMLVQIQDRGETAIVYDPEREYTPQFFNPSRGDVILNPLDARTPYWSPGDEARNEPEALTLAASLFPDRNNEQRFFTRAPREIFAHLLTYKPTPQDLAEWLSHDEEIDSRVRGTEMASVIAPTAPGQREGVMAELKMIGKALKLLPNEKETKTRWNTLQWSKQRRGWIFLTSTKTTRERLLPLTSLWLDLLVLRLMDEGAANHQARSRFGSSWTSSRLCRSYPSCTLPSPKIGSRTTRWFWVSRGAANWKRFTGTRRRRCSRNRRRKSFCAPASPTPRGGSAKPSARWKSSSYERATRPTHSPVIANRKTSNWSAVSSRW